MHRRDVRACDARECTTRAVALGLQASDKQKCNVALLGPGVPGIQPPPAAFHPPPSPPSLPAQRRTTLQTRRPLV